MPAGGRVLVVGASGSIGRHAVRAALAAGLRTRALVRDDSKAGMFPDDVEVIVADTSRPETLGRAVDGVHGVVLTQGTYDESEARQATTFRSSACSVCWRCCAGRLASPS